MTVTSLIAALPVGISLAGQVAVRSDPAGRAGTGTGQEVTVSPVQAVTLLSALHPIEPLRTGPLAEGPSPARQTGAGSTHMVAGRSVITLTAVPTSRPERARGAFLVTVAAAVSRLTDALPRHRVAAPVAVPAVTRVHAVRTPEASVTGSPAVVSCPAWGAGTASRDGIAATVVLTHAAQQAALAKAPRRALILTELAHVAWQAVTQAGLHDTHPSVLTHWAGLQTAYSPATLGAISLTAGADPPSRTSALSAHPVARGSSAGAWLQAVHSEPSLWTRLIAVLSAVARRTLSLARAAHVIAGHTRGTLALSLATRAIETRAAFILAGAATVAGLADTAPVPPVAFLGVPLHTPTLLRAAGSKRPLRAWKVAVSPVETWVAQAGSVGAVAAPVVGTVTLLIAVLPVETLRAAILTHLPTHSRGAAAASSDGVTGRSVLTLAGEAAVLTEGPLWASLVAHDPGPAVRALTAVPLRATHSSVRAVLARQAAVVTKRVVQAHEFLSQGVLSTQLPLALVVLLSLLEELGVLLSQQSHLGDGSLHGSPAVQGFHWVLQRNAAPAVLIQLVSDLAVTLEGAGSVLAGVITAPVVGQALVLVITATPIDVEPVTGPTVALVAPRIVGAILLTTGVPSSTLIYIHACLLVLIQRVAVVTAADRSSSGVTAVV